MALVALITLLILLQYLVFTMLCGVERGRSGLAAPAMTGDPGFERAYRVQMNTLEQLLVTLPALWLSGLYFIPEVAASLGLAFFIGRILYRNSYIKDPAKRGPGMVIGFLANIGLLVTALWGLAPHLW